ncbi:hypothetical protein [Tenacibaculum crassostreae]|uniref:hypothetical protein n=1 Tax=Tenacibaculum crassostreae TaxID=502683 RepID=UPI003895E929
MSKDYNSSVFKDLLDRLQQDSWQLELLISGFAIFGLFSAIGPIEINYEIAKHDSKLAETILWYAIKVSCWILISNLLIHVILRGLWIGALGLRYVSGDIDYKELKYTSKFTNYLQTKIGSFDKYIANLENYCSVLFAVSFLFIFYFLACLFTLLGILFTVFIFLDTDLDGIWEKISTFIGIVLIVFIFSGAFLTFIDFITQGFLKKKKWLVKVYFPVYRIFSLLTLSFLYRPLVYNFLDNRFGRRLSFVVVPIYAFILFSSTYTYNKSNYLKEDRKSSEIYANPNNYEDQLINDTDFIEVATIPSKVITDNHLNIFIAFNERLEDKIFNYNKDLKPKEDIRGLKSKMLFWNSFIKNKDSLIHVYHKTFNDMFSVYINKTKYPTEFIATKNKRKNLGYETYINIDSLSAGNHLLKITRKRIHKNDTTNIIIAKIPFWHYKK